MKERKSYILIFSIFLVLFFGIILSIAFLRSTIQLRSTQTKERSLSAFYAAEVAVERAIDELRKDKDWKTGFGDKNDPAVVKYGAEEVVGYYWIDRNDDIKDGGRFRDWSNTVWIRAWGQDKDRKTIRVIFARIAVQSLAEYFLSTPYKLNILGGRTIKGDVLARDVEFRPGNSTVNINGKVFYINDVINEDDPKVNVNCDDESCIVKIPSITFVSVDLDWYKKLAEDKGKYVNEDFSISGEISRSSLEAENGLIYIDGDVTIDDVTVKEPLHIVASGDIHIKGNIKKDGDSAQLGLSAGGDVIIDEDAPDILTIEAFIRANGGIFKAEGGSYSKEKLTINGAINVRGREDRTSAVNLSVYKNCNYSYDDSLKNLNIPFVNYVANVVQWEEKDPNDTFPPP